jgi:hypothetical protein
MFLRITRGTFDPFVVDRVIPLAEEIKVVLSELPGGIQVYQALDRSAGKWAT